MSSAYGLGEFQVAAIPFEYLWERSGDRSIRLGANPADLDTGPK